MRVNINLATQKYEDAREFYTRWGSAVALGVVVTLVLGFFTWSNFRSTEQDRKRLAELRSQISELERSKAANEAILNRPENQEARDQARFWNDVIDQKYLSWTRLFSDLEKIMPARAFVLSVKPSLESDRRLKLELVIGGEKHENAVDLIRRMESSDRFRLTRLINEAAANPSRGQNIFQFGIETYYNPAVVAQPAGQQKAGAKEGAL
jgi:Tfp pilus assembly protein PilN